MKGNGVGLLYMYKQEGYTATLLWTMRGDQGDRWNQVIIPIGRMHAPFQVRTFFF
jgi:hypothetical protein